MTLKELRSANLVRDNEVFRKIDFWSSSDWACAFVIQVCAAMKY